MKLKIVYAPLKNQQANDPVKQLILTNRDKDRKMSLLFLWPSSSGVPEALGKRVVVDFKLSDFLVLVGGDSDELGLLEDVGPEGRVGQLQDVVGPHQVEPRLVLVHRVEDGLKKIKVVLKKVVLIKEVMFKYLKKISSSCLIGL